MGFEQDYKGLQDYYEARRLNTRIHVIQVLFGAVLVLYLFAFWYLQIVKVDYYRRLSDNNRLRRVTICETERRAVGGVSAITVMLVLAAVEALPPLSVAIRVTV